MATQPKFDAETELMIDDLIASGRFADRADVFRHGVRLAYDEDHVADEPLDAETLAWLEERVAEADANPDAGIPADDVFDELERRCREDIEQARAAG